MIGSGRFSDASDFIEQIVNIVAERSVMTFGTGPSLKASSVAPMQNAVRLAAAIAFAKDHSVGHLSSPFPSLG
jgi:hypothetical protein